MLIIIIIIIIAIIAIIISFTTFIIAIIAVIVSVCLCERQSAATISQSSIIPLPKAHKISILSI